MKFNTILNNYFIQLLILSISESNENMKFLESDVNSDKRHITRLDTEITKYGLVMFIKGLGIIFL